MNSEFNVREIFINELIRKYVKPLYSEDYDMLSSNPLLRIEDVIKHPNVEWDYKKISSNPMVTWEVYEANPDFTWVWSGLCQNPNFTLEHILKIPRSWYNVSLNPNVTMEFVKANPQYNWSYLALSINPNITWKDIEDNFDKSWDWYIVGKRSDIVTTEIIKKHITLFPASALCQNINLTPEIVLKYPDMFEYSQFFVNPEIMETLNLKKVPWYFMNLDSKYYTIEQIIKYMLNPYILLVLNLEKFDKLMDEMMDTYSKNPCDIYEYIKIKYPDIRCEIGDKNEMLYRLYYTPINGKIRRLEELKKIKKCYMIMKIVFT
jgi:hypothetical protein